ncbi:SEL1-like repeat protein, partial [Mesorhizobium sp. M8A.F.Ca.ET.182.01.1.1]|uniref:SEL1-like repeat protein n=1 Tax=Mesorhizobium sp. M8A.F.Ca.ET.182.01.1.1 TaxID=2563964 RepID=UPI00109BFAC4
MARFDISDIEMAAGGETRADTLCNLGLVYATGRGCKVDLIAAHKWLNIAALSDPRIAAMLS